MVNLYNFGKNSAFVRSLVENCPSLTKRLVTLPDRDQEIRQEHFQGPSVCHQVPVSKNAWTRVAFTANTPRDQRTGHLYNRDTRQNPNRHGRACGCKGVQEHDRRPDSTSDVNSLDGRQTSKVQRCRHQRQRRCGHGRFCHPSITMVQHLAQPLSRHRPRTLLR